MMENGSNPNVQTFGILHPKYDAPNQESSKTWLSSFFESLKNIFCIRLYKEKQPSPQKNWNKRKSDLEQPRKLSIQLSNKRKPHFLNAINLISEGSKSTSTTIKSKPLIDQKMEENIEKINVKRKEPEYTEKLNEIPIIVGPVAKVIKAEDAIIAVKQKKISKKLSLMKEQDNLAITIKKQIEKMKDTLAETINAGISELNNSQKIQILEKEKLKASIYEKLVMPRKKTQEAAVQASAPRILEKLAVKANPNSKTLNKNIQDDEGLKNSGSDNVAKQVKEEKKEIVKLTNENSIMSHDVKSFLSPPLSKTDVEIAKEKPKEKEEEKHPKNPPTSNLFGNSINNSILFGTPPAPKEAPLIAEPPKKPETINFFNNNKQPEGFNISPKKMTSEDDSKLLFAAPKMENIFTKPVDGEMIVTNPEVHANISQSLFAPPLSKTEVAKENMNVETKFLPGLFKKPSETVESIKLFPSTNPPVSVSLSISAPTSNTQPASILNVPINVAPTTNKLFNDAQPMISQTLQQISPPRPNPPILGQPSNSSLPSTIFGSSLFGPHSGNAPSLFGQNIVQQPAVSTIGLSLNNSPAPLFQSTLPVNNIAQSTAHPLFSSFGQIGQPTNLAQPKPAITPFSQNAMFQPQANNAPGLFGTGAPLFGSNPTQPTNSKL